MSVDRSYLRKVLKNSQRMSRQIRKAMNAPEQYTRRELLSLREDLNRMANQLNAAQSALGGRIAQQQRQQKAISAYTTGSALKSAERKV